MAEGIFDPAHAPIPGVTVDTLYRAMVRILPSTLVRYELVDSAEAARAIARNEMLPEGTELWHRAYTQEQAARCDDPAFALAMVNHEFCKLVSAGAAFPQTVKLDGGGSGFAVSAAGHVVTNLHLVSSEIEHHEREAGAINTEVRCTQLRAQIAAPEPSGVWRWRDCDAVYLVSNPPFSRGYHQDESGGWHLREDTALLRVEPAPSGLLRLSPRSVAIGEQVWMAGFPLRGQRSPAALARLGYRDPDGSLRVSTGRVTGEEGEDYFVTDLDGAMGNSGSAVFDGGGRVIGMFSRAHGKGAPRNAVEYGSVQRVQVRSRLAIEGLALRDLLGASAVD